MKPILCVGDAHVDMMFPSQTTLQLQQQAAKGEDVSQRVQSQVVATPGGIILNTAGALARLGVSTMYGGSLGTDRFGRMAVEHMENLGVDVSCAVFKPQYATMMVFCINRVAAPVAELRPRSPEDLRKTVWNLLHFLQRLGH